MDYHSDRFQDFSLMIYNNDRLVGLLPANISGSEVFSHQGLTYGSLIFKSNERFATILNYFKAVLQFLERQNIKRLHLKLLPDIYCRQSNEAILYMLHCLKAHNYRTDTLSVVNPRNKRYSRDRLAGHKRGKKQHLEVVETHDFSDFWDTILIPNLQGKHNVKPVHTLTEIELLKSRFPDKIRQFNVYHHGNIVAGTTIFDTSFVAHSQYISANSKKNTLGSLDFLHIHLLENVFTEKRYFDFGISNENNGKTINEGLLYWKEGFGSFIKTQRFYTIETSNYMLLDTILR